MTAMCWYTASLMVRNAMSLLSCIEVAIWVTSHLDGRDQKAAHINPAFHAPQGHHHRGLEA